MKIVLINSVCRSGSTGKIAYDLCTALNADGHEAVVCYGRGPRQDDPLTYKFGLDPETYLHALLTRLTGLTGCFSFFSTRRLLRFLKKFRPDVVHLHELHAYFVNYAPVIRYLKKHGIKTVWTFHCEFMYTGKCGVSFDCKRWQNGCGNCPYLREYPKTLALDFTRTMWSQKRRLFENFKNLTLVTPSHYLAKRVRESFLREHSVMVIPNGINTSVFYPRDTAALREKLQAEGRKIVLAVAPDLMSRQKGGRYVLQLAQKMQQEAVLFILIGVTDPSAVSAPNVIAMNRTEDQNELAAYYSLADCLVICSEHENFPTVCLEALCCGTPVCGFDCGGTAETAPGTLGAFVPTGDCEALAKELRTMLSHPDAEALSRSCADYGRTHYAKEVMYAEYWKLYGEN